MSPRRPVCHQPFCARQLRAARMTRIGRTRTPAPVGPLPTITALPIAACSPNAYCSPVDPAFNLRRKGAERKHGRAGRRVDSSTASPSASFSFFFFFLKIQWFCDSLAERDNCSTHTRSHAHTHIHTRLETHTHSSELWIYFLHRAPPPPPHLRLGYPTRNQVPQVA